MLVLNDIMVFCLRVASPINISSLLSVSVDSVLRRKMQEYKLLQSVSLDFEIFPVTAVLQNKIEWTAWLLIITILHI